MKSGHFLAWHLALSPYSKESKEWFLYEFWWVLKFEKCLWNYRRSPGLLLRRLPYKVSPKLQITNIYGFIADGFVWTSRPTEPSYAERRLDNLTDLENITVAGNATESESVPSAFSYLRCFVLVYPSWFYGDNTGLELHLFTFGVFFAAVLGSLSMMASVLAVNTCDANLSDICLPVVVGLSW